MPTSIEPASSVNLTAIAEHLNLSTATVSRALRNVPGTHPRTKSLVMSAAAELGYRSQRTRARPTQAVGRRAVGVLMHGVQEGRNLAFLEGLTQGANDLDVSLVLQKFGRTETESLFKTLKKALAREENLAGVLLIHRWSNQMVSYLTDQYDCVSLVHHYPSISLDVVDMNHVQGIARLMSHLHQLGHRRIGFVGRNAELSWAKARFGGYVQTLYGLGLFYDPDWMVDVPTELLEEPNYTEAWNPIVDHVAGAVERGVTAWMASSDWVGYALCRGLLDRGLSVPGDVSVSGFDTDEPQALGCPRLTSVQVPKQQMGAEALGRLLRRRDEPQQVQHTSLFECALSRGQTTAAPPK